MNRANDILLDQQRKLIKHLKKPKFTPEQRRFMEFAKDKEIIIMSATAGVGKAKKS